MPFNDVQPASVEHAHDTPHHDLRGILHALDDTVLSETFSRHVTVVLHSLVLALDDALVAKNHLHSVHIHLLVNLLTLGWKSNVTFSLCKPLSDVTNVKKVLYSR